MNESFMPFGILVFSVQSSWTSALAVWTLRYGGQPIVKSPMRFLESAKGLCIEIELQDI